MTAQALEQHEPAVVIGLEVHVRPETTAKVFCSYSTESAEDEEPSTRACLVCLGLPGALPMLNEMAVESAAKIGKALDVDIAEDTCFHRKNYYYPDLPKSFWITRYDAPIYADGMLEVSVEDTRRDINITRTHLEEDPRSLQRKDGGIDTAGYTPVNYNHTDTPLVEAVTEPDFRSPQETRAFPVKFEEVLEYPDMFDATRDGSLRISVNISLVPADEINGDGTISDDAFGAANRTEVKDISSHKGTEKALTYGVTRRKNATQHGRATERETRHWDESRGITVSMRSKEEEKDYCYFRETDFSLLQVAHRKKEIPIPELPDTRHKCFRTEYGIDEEFVSKLTLTKEVAGFFKGVVVESGTDLTATWAADSLLGELSYRDMHITDVSDRLDELMQPVEPVAANEVMTKDAEKIVLRETLDEDKDPDTIVNEAGLSKTGDGEIGGFVQEAIDGNPDAVEGYHNGEGGALNFLAEQVMQKSQGNTDLGIVNQLLHERLDE